MGEYEVIPVHQVRIIQEDESDDPEDGSDEYDSEEALWLSGGSVRSKSGADSGLKKLSRASNGYNVFADRSFKWCWWFLIAAAAGVALVVVGSIFVYSVFAAASSGGGTRNKNISPLPQTRHKSTRTEAHPHRRTVRTSATTGTTRTSSKPRKMSKTPITPKSDPRQVKLADLEEFKWALRLNDSLDRTQDPCTNFFAFACGGWIAQNPLPLSNRNLTKWSVFSKAQWEINKWAEHMLDNPTTTAVTSRRPFQLAKVFFDSCVNRKMGVASSEPSGAELAEALVDELVNQTLAQFGNFTMPGFLGGVLNKFGLNFGIRLDVIEFQSPLAIPGAAGSLRKFGVKIGEAFASWKNQNDLYFSITGTGIPLGSDQLHPYNFQELLQLLRNDSSTRERQWKHFFRAAFTNVTSDLNSVLFAAQHVPELQAFADSHFDDEYNRSFWTTLIGNSLFKLKNGGGLWGDSKLFFEKEPWIPNISLFGQEKLGRAKECCALETMSEFPHAISAAYVETHVTPDSIAEARLMLRQVQTSFKERVDESSLWTERTKTFVKAKVDAMITNVGYPDWILNERALDDFYEGLYLSSNMSHLEIKVNLKFGFQIRTLLARTVVDPSNVKYEWVTPVLDVNAGNVQPRNAIEVPGAVFRPPFHGQPRASLKFGALGVIMAHELTHGFDDSGRKYGILGEENNWMDSESEANFKDEVACLEEQRYFYPDIWQPTDPNATLNEDIADLGGVALAYRAYQTHVREHGIEKPLFGAVEFSPEQLFYISCAQTYCSTSSSVGLLKELLFEPHSPNEVRVFHMVRNHPEFQSVWNCPPVTARVEEKRCKIW